MLVRFCYIYGRHGRGFLRKLLTLLCRARLSSDYLVRQAVILNSALRFVKSQNFPVPRLRLKLAILFMMEE